MTRGVDGMLKNELRFFNVFPSVVRAGSVSEITIETKHKKFMLEGEYKIRIVPKEKRELSRNWDNMREHEYFHTEVSA